jgi:hypothetical protein
LSIFADRRGASGGVVSGHSLYRHTFTHTQIFLKFSQWHCCSRRQVFPFLSCANAACGAEKKTEAKSPQQRTKASPRIVISFLCERFRPSSCRPVAA